MGRPIVYCDTCGERILESELTQGKAWQDAGRYFCVRCKPAGVASTPAASAPGGKTGTASIPRVAAPRFQTTVSRPAPKKSAAPAAVVGIVCAGALGVLLFAAFGGRSGTPSPPSASKTSTTEPAIPPSPPGPGTKADPRPVWEELERFAAANPAALQEILDRCQAAREKLSGSAYDNRLNDLRDRTGQKLREAGAARKVDDLVAKAREAAKKDPEFLRKAEALGLLEQARGAGTGFGTLIDRVVAVETEYDRAFNAAAGAAWKKASEEAEALFAQKKDVQEALRTLESFPVQFREGEWARKLGLQKQRYGATPPPVTPSASLWEDYEQGTRLMVQNDNYREGAKLIMDVIRRCNDTELLRRQGITDAQLENIATTGYYNVSCYFARDEKDLLRACEFLEGAFRAGYDDWDHFDKDKDFDPIRNDERFRALVRKWHKRSLGLQGHGIEEDEAKKLGLAKDQGGVLIGKVFSGGVADKAGLRLGDVLVEIDRKTLPLEGTLEKMRDIVGAVKTGVDVPAVVMRDRKKIQLKLRWPKE